MKFRYIVLVLILFVAMYVFISSDNSGESKENNENNALFSNSLFSSGSAESSTSLNSEEYYCPDCNVVLILIDTLRRDRLATYGYFRNTSPNIDRLAKESTVFENMLAQSSWTKPAMASIFTGLYPKNHGVNRREDVLGEDRIILAEILKENGYVTSAFITNPSVGGTTGFNQGYVTFIESIYPDDNADTLHQLALPEIDKLNPDSKQFIYVHYMEPHFPYEPQKVHFSKEANISLELLKKFYSSGVSVRDVDNLGGDYAKAREMIEKGAGDYYDDEILTVDSYVQILLETLQKNNLYNNSIIIILSDHGEELYEHGWGLHGTSLYREQVEVPLIIRHPQASPKRVHEQISHVNILPSLLDMLGIEKKGMDGSSIFDKINTLAYSELDLDGKIFSSITDSGSKKVIVGASTDRVVKKIARWIYWLPEVYEVSYNESMPVIEMISFHKSKNVELFYNGQNYRNATVGAKETYVHLRPPPELVGGEIGNITIVSSSPCTPVSKIGVLNSSLCLGVGIYDREVDFDYRIKPKYDYFDLVSDYFEQENIYGDPSGVILEQQLYDYLSKKEEQNTAQAEFSSNELEALKALGYLN